jgi:hypothetical protein
MDETIDLETALQFVTLRIEEEAARAGEPITDEERALLEDLPTEVAPATYSSGPESPAPFAPRDLAFERLCALAKAAYRQDLQLDPNDGNWQFAKAVTELHRHPMAWLLGWAGIKRRRPWWDGCLLIAAAMISICLWMIFLFVGTEARMPFRWVIAVIGCAAVVAAMHSGTRSMERSQLRRTIDRSRRS